MSGVIQGGWEYVGAAYGISAVTFLAFAVYLLVRARQEGVR